MSTDRQRRRQSRAETVYRTICAALAVAAAIYASYAGLLGSIALLGLDDTAHPTEARTFPLGALACLVAAVWAGVLAHRSAHRGYVVPAGAASGVMLAAGTFYLWGGGTPQAPLRTTIGLVFAGVQVAAVPVLALLLHRPPRPGPAVALGAGLVLVGAGAMSYASGTHDVEAHETITHQITAVIVGSGSGDITIHGNGPPGTVEVVRRARLGVRGDLPPLVFSDNSQLILSARQLNSEDSGISYEVRVPAGVRVAADTVSGTVRADGEFSSVVLQTATGNVRANLSATAVFAYATAGGSIDLRLQSAPTELTTDAFSGNVDVRLPADQVYAVETRSGSGVTQVTVQQDSASTHRVKATSGSGDISVQPG